MAERRMFARTIVESDSFIEMPLSAQAVYFHLAMRADDDGFVSNPKGTLRMIGGSEDDCRLLMMKGLVHIFESGVVAIRNWRIHNYIRGDRYKPTIFLEEKERFGELFSEEEKPPRSLCERSGQPLVNQRETQDRLGKDRLGKDRLVEDRLGEDRLVEDRLVEDRLVEDRLVEDRLVEDRSGEDKTGESRAEEKVSDDIKFCERIIELYNSICVSLSSVIALNETRQQAILERRSTYTLEQFEQMFRKAQKSDFLCGRGEGSWRASFDWLIKDRNFPKVLEGVYDNRHQSGASYDVDEYEQYSIFA